MLSAVEFPTLTVKKHSGSFVHRILAFHIGRQILIACQGIGLACFKGVLFGTVQEEMDGLHR